MPDTLVSYHADGYEPARPAIDVKDHHSGMDLVMELQKLAGSAEAVLGASDPVTHRYSDRLLEAAYERVQSDFWQAAEQIATERGLGPIEQQGRSGGWLVFVDGGDPDAMRCSKHGLDGRAGVNPVVTCEECLVQAADRREWLAAYRAMREWTEQYIADVPRKVAALAQQMAMDEAGEAAARRMFPVDHEEGE